jgi:hypothetical protein
LVDAFGHMATIDEVARTTFVDGVLWPRTAGALGTK